MRDQDEPRARVAELRQTRRSLLGQLTAIAKGAELAHQLGFIGPGGTVENQTEAMRSVLDDVDKCSAELRRLREVLSAPDAD